MSCLPPSHFPLRISCANLPERLECQRVMQLKRSVKPIASGIVLVRVRRSAIGIVAAFGRESHRFQVWSLLVLTIIGSQTI